MFRLKYQSSRLFNILTVIILSALCVLLNVLTRIDFHKLELPKNKPEYSATDFQANLYTPQGVLIYQVSAESGIQFPDSNRIVMQNLTLQTFNESTTQIAQQLTSKDGWLDNQTLLGFLGESVIITFFESVPSQNINVYTKNVNINGKTKFANSSAPIRAVQGKSVLTGIGFSVDYDKKLLVIESNVKVIYDK
ncbi:MAG TPA: LPS export ABC transporter periplasmic protein LptC [Burkholderiales bacterium]|jgi:LPS export ABC transporter protein LptC|nr:LPS export ABC transporter periplasmic protein LptC [Burkholderiales bacterium]